MTLFPSNSRVSQGSQVSSHTSPFWEGEAKAGSGQAVPTLALPIRPGAKTPAFQCCRLVGPPGTPEVLCFCRSVSSELMCRQPGHKDGHSGGRERGRAGTGSGHFQTCLQPSRRGGTGRSSGV